MVQIILIWTAVKQFPEVAERMGLKLGCVVDFTSDSNKVISFRKKVVKFQSFLLSTYEQGRWSMELLHQSGY